MMPKALKQMLQHNGELLSDVLDAGERRPCLNSMVFTVAQLLRYYVISLHRLKLDYALHHRAVIRFA